MKTLPNKLALYRAAVQHPQAEVAFLHRAYFHYRQATPLLLKEDFAGTAAVASAWVALDGDHQAMAVEQHGPTVRWAMRQAKRDLGERAADLHLVHDDVLAVTAPKVDIVVALNFSAFICHDRASLLRYFDHARRSLRTSGPGGLLVIDAYGGPGAMRPGEQRRPARTDAGEPFEYRWEQRRFNPVTARVENHIHFALPRRRVMKSAFRYDWRLWTPPEIIELMHEAGFEIAELWCDRFDTRKKQSDGVYRPLKEMDAREDWVAYVIGA